MKVRDEEREIKCGCGVIQGENLACNIFIFMMQLAVEEIMTALKTNNIEIINLKHYEVTGKMKLHRLKHTTCTSTKK